MWNYNQSLHSPAKQPEQRTPEARAQTSSAIEAAADEVRKRELHLEQQKQTLLALMKQVCCAELRAK